MQDPIHIDNHNEPEPDIALLKPREDFYAENHPPPEDILLLIERFMGGKFECAARYVVSRL